MADELRDYVNSVVKEGEAGRLPSAADPGDPGDLGTALTQPEIDILKRFIKEIQERFLSL